MLLLSSPPMASAAAPLRPELHSVRMSDGVTLAASVYRSPGSQQATQRRPVLLSITPYGKDVPVVAETGAGGPERFVRQGYIFVLADVRGTGSSEGSFGSLDEREVRDSVELIDWAAKLPGANGKVGMIGGSYQGVNAVAAAGAVGRGSPLKAIFPLRTHTDFYRDLAVPGGIYNAVFDFPYGLVLQAGLGLLTPFLDPRLDLGLVGKLTARSRVIADSIFGRQLIDGFVGGGPLAYRGAYWRERSLVRYIRRVPRNDVAVLASQAWFDIWPRGSTLLYTMLQNAAAGRPLHRPWQARTADPRFGVIVDPMTHQGKADAALATATEWFDHWLKGRPSELASYPRPFRAYELLGGRWIESRSWPPRAARVRTFGLSGARSGTAPLSANDGTLAARSAAPSQERIRWLGVTSPCARMNEQEFLVGGFQAVGNTLGISTENPCSFDDWSQHPTSLTFTGPALRRARTVAGPVGVDLLLSSSTDQVELVATLAEVSPTGQSRPLATGDLLGSLRRVDRRRSWMIGGHNVLPYHSYAKVDERPVPIGRPVRYRFEIPPTLARIRPGHRLRITLSTAMTPYLQPKMPDQRRLFGGSYRLMLGEGGSRVHVPLVDPRRLRTSPTAWGPCFNDC